MTEETPDELFGFVELSAVTGMSTSTLSTLLHRSRFHRKTGKIIANDIPEPDAYLGASPVWFQSTVEKWLDTRANGPDSVRVRRAVNPKESIKRGRAVPLDSEEEKIVSDEEVVHRDIGASRKRFTATIMNRIKESAKKTRYRSNNPMEENR